MMPRLFVAAALVLAAVGCGSSRTVEGAESGCASCHGFPPATTAHAAVPADPVDATACNQCHPTTVDASGAIIPASDGGTHGSGAVSCSGCHGFPPRTNLHPRPATGSWTALDCHRCHSATVDAAGGLVGTEHTLGKNDCGTCHVYPSASGAHATHLSGASYSSGFPCASCHPGVGAYAPSHPDGVTQVAFGAAVGGTGSFAAGACSSVYCHGSFTGGAAATPTWTGGPAACGDCHASPPTTGQHTFHLKYYSCDQCHPGYSPAAVDKALHVNGARDVTLIAGTWDAAARTCTATCHAGTRNW